MGQRVLEQEEAVAQVLASDRKSRLLAPTGQDAGVLDSWSTALSSWSFTDALSGVLKFARLVKVYETQDPEIAAMSLKLKSLFLPPMTAPPLGGGVPSS
ncbi:UNVERIFIED_CONTAM: hypothetical protein FKN15_009497 [Acipenser sinensis]